MQAISRSSIEASAAVTGEGAELMVLSTLREAVQAVASQHTHFTTDDITDKAAITPREPRVLGAVMLWAQKQGLCLPTGNYRRSRHPECHKRPKMIWRSQVCGEAASTS